MAPRTKNIRLVAIDKELVHETGEGKVCFGWSREPEEKKRDEDVLKAFGDYKYGFNAIDDHEGDICKACLWLFEPYCGPLGIVLDSRNIWYDTGSRAYHSKWWVGRFLQGDANRLYNQEYGPIVNIERDVVDAIRKEIERDGVGGLGGEKGDKEALAEIQEVFGFLDKWCGKEGVDVLCIKEG